MSPRVVPTKKRWPDDAILRSWQAYTYDTPDGVAFTIRRGTRLKASHPAVKAAPWNWIEDVASDDEEPSPYSFATPEPPLKFDGPQKVRLRWTTQINARLFEAGQVVELPAATAAELIEQGNAELA